MQSWSDSFLNSVNDYSQLLGLVALFLTFVFGYIVYATAKESTARASEREAAAEARADDLQKKASEAIQRAADLEEAQKPRSITPEQTQSFIAELSAIPKGKVVVYIYNQDAEIAQYANQIKSVLTSAGFDTSKIVGVAIGSSFTPTGVIMVVKSKDNLPPFALPLQIAFTHIGIEAKGAIDPGLTEGDIKIVVGRKSN